MIFVTLVHGTWARGLFGKKNVADWTTEKSLIVRALRDKFGDEVEISRFNWSGGNSHNSRIKGAAKLRNFLTKNLKLYPGYKHFIISHSHGGNVVLSSITEDLKEEIDGIVCMATPFLSARKRDLGLEPVWPIICSVISLAGYIGLKFSSLVGSESWSWWGWLLFWTLICMFVFHPLLIGFKKLTSISESVAKNLSDELKVNAPERRKLLIVRSPGDEASAAITLFQFLSQLSIRLFFIAYSLILPIEKWVYINAEKRYKSIIFLWIFFMISSGISYFISLKSEPLLASFLALVFVLLFISFLAFTLFVPKAGSKGVLLIPQLIVSALIWPVVAVLSLSLFPYGWQAAVANLFLDISVEATPDGSWDVHSINIPKSEKLGMLLPPMKHGVYDNPEAISKIVNWIK